MCRLLHLDFSSTQGDKQVRVQLHFTEIEITVVLVLLWALFNDLIFTNPLEDYYYPPFTDDKTEAQRREVICMAPCQVSGITDQAGFEPSFWSHHHGQLNFNRPE